MTDRRVTHTGKNEDGTISSLCNPGQWWSPRAKADAVKDINDRLHRYYVLGGGGEVDVRVVNGHLRTDPDQTDKNNLLELPHC
jgi:hypothetical protein